MPCAAFLYLLEAWTQNYLPYTTANKVTNKNSELEFNIKIERAYTMLSHHVVTKGCIVLNEDGFCHYTSTAHPVIRC